MLLKIDRIRDERIKDPETGIAINDPLNPGRHKKREVVKPSSININDIEEIRPFEKDHKKHANIEGEISVIHKYKSLGDRSSEVHVLGNYLDLIEKCNELKRGNSNSKG